MPKQGGKNTRQNMNATSITVKEILEKRYSNKTSKFKLIGVLTFISQGKMTKNSGTTIYCIKKYYEYKND